MELSSSLKILLGVVGVALVALITTPSSSGANVIQMSFLQDQIDSNSIHKINKNNISTVASVLLVGTNNSALKSKESGLCFLNSLIEFSADGQIATRFFVFKGVSLSMYLSQLYSKIQRGDEINVPLKISIFAVGLVFILLIFFVLRFSVINDFLSNPRL